MPLEFVKGQKGNLLLFHEGHLFKKEREGSEGKVIWRCVKYMALKCKGRVHTFGNDVVYSQGHNHIADVAEAHVKGIIGNIKERALEIESNPQCILASASENVCQSVAGQLPTKQNLRRTIQRVRQVASMAPSNPIDLSSLVIPEKYQMTSSGEKFLLFDSGPGTDRILIFSTEQNLAILASSEHWYADGTFKTTPPLFSQIFTIHATKFHSIIPVVFALLPSKTRQAYLRVLEALKVLKPDLNPVSVMTDFELAQIQAFKQVFPTISNRGCLFHFSQCIWRKIQENPDIREKYVDDADPDFSLYVRQLMALAFVPPEFVNESFQELIRTPFFEQNYGILRPLLDYFEDNWIGANTRRSALFDVTLWNCFHTTLEDLPKTNNAVEGWHTAFSSLIRASHPTIWKFIEALQKEQSLFEVRIVQFIAGHLPSQSNAKYRKCAERIKRIVQEFEERHLDDYLLGLAHNLKLQA